MTAIETGHIYNLKAENLLAALPDASIDLIVTSPPYDKLRTYKGFTWDFELVARESYRVLKQGGVLVWVVGDATIDGSETLTSFRQALYFVDTCGFNMHQSMIYEKDGMPYPPQRRYYSITEHMFVLSKGEPKTFNGISERSRYSGEMRRSTMRQQDGSTKSTKQLEVSNNRLLTNIWRMGAGYMRTTKDIEAFEHPAMFPETLAERHILTWSNPNDTVLDYFGGSGTTAKMARIHNRQWITGDISAEYCALMERRLANPYTIDMLSLLEQPHGEA